MKPKELEIRQEVICRMKNLWKIKDSGIARMFKISRERVSQILEKCPVDKPLDTFKRKK